MSQGEQQLTQIEFGLNGFPICGKYCKFLTPDQERSVILEAIRQNILDFYRA